MVEWIYTMQEPILWAMGVLAFGFFIQWCIQYPRKGNQAKTILVFAFFASSFSSYAQSGLTLKQANDKICTFRKRELANTKHELLNLLIPGIKDTSYVFSAKETYSILHVYGHYVKYCLSMCEKCECVGYSSCFMDIVRVAIGERREREMFEGF